MGVTESIERIYGSLDPVAQKAFAKQLRAVANNFDPKKISKNVKVYSAYEATRQAYNDYIREMVGEKGARYDVGNNTDLFEPTYKFLHRRGLVPKLEERDIHDFADTKRIREATSHMKKMMSKSFQEQHFLIQKDTFVRSLGFDTSTDKGKILREQILNMSQEEWEDLHMRDTQLVNEAWEHYKVSTLPNISIPDLLEEKEGLLKKLSKELGQIAKRAFKNSPEGKAKKYSQEKYEQKKERSRKKAEQKKLNDEIRKAKKYDKQQEAKAKEKRARKELKAQTDRINKEVKEAEKYREKAEQKQQKRSKEQRKQEKEYKKKQKERIKQNEKIANQNRDARRKEEIQKAKEYNKKQDEKLKKRRKWQQHEKRMKTLARKIGKPVAIFGTGLKIANVFSKPGQAKQIFDTGKKVISKTISNPLKDTFRYTTMMVMETAHKMGDMIWGGLQQTYDYVKEHGVRKFGEDALDLAAEMKKREFEESGKAINEVVEFVTDVDLSKPWESATKVGKKAYEKTMQQADAAKEKGMTTVVGTYNAITEGTKTLFSEIEDQLAPTKVWEKTKDAVRAMGEDKYTPAQYKQMDAYEARVNAAPKKKR